MAEFQIGFFSGSPDLVTTSLPKFGKIHNIHSRPNPKPDD